MLSATGAGSRKARSRSIRWPSLRARAQLAAIESPNALRPYASEAKVRYCRFVMLAPAVGTGQPRSDQRAGSIVILIHPVPEQDKARQGGARLTYRSEAALQRAPICQQSMMRRWYAAVERVAERSGASPRIRFAWRSHDVAQNRCGSNSKKPNRNDGTKHGQAGNRPARHVNRTVGFRRVHHRVMPVGHISLLKRFPAKPAPDLIREPAPDLIREPAPDLIRGWRPVGVKKTRQIKIWSPVSLLSKRKRLRKLPLVDTSAPAVVRFKYDNRSTGLPVPSGAKERVPDAGKNEDGKAEADH